MATAQLLSVEGVSKSFPGVQALKDVHLDLNSGEVLALVGENGAGKSTLMKVLSGIYKRDTGVIKLNNQPIEVDGPLQAQKLGIAIIHQEMNLMPHLTVAQNILIGREPRKLFGIATDDKELNRQAKILLDELHLNLDPNQLVGKLTVAKQQMVEIAKALSYDSKIIIMDEPTSALTQSETDVLFTIIGNLRKSGKGIIYISHRMEELTKISDRITVFRDGQYIDTLITKDTKIAKIISLMIGREVAQDIRPDQTKKFSDSEVALEIKGLSTKNLLKDISFQLRKGEILGFAGLMGAGRTELALAIVGKDQISTGEIIIKGKKVKINNPAAAVANGIGYLSEDRKRYGVLLNQDVKFNLVLSNLRRLTSKIGFVNTAKSKGLSNDAVKNLIIRTPTINQMVKNLSGGNQQKVVIGKWLTRETDILIFDEPTRGIDVGAKDEVYKLIGELAKAGKSIIMISSELPEVLRMSDRILVMCEGRVTGILTNKEADQNLIMQYATKYR
jgi:ribose transport system ATP-binding protein